MLYEGVEGNQIGVGMAVPLKDLKPIEDEVGDKVWCFNDSRGVVTEATKWGEDNYIAVVRFANGRRGPMRHIDLQPYIGQDKESEGISGSIELPSDKLTEQWAKANTNQAKKAWDGSIDMQSSKFTPTIPDQVEGAVYSGLSIAAGSECRHAEMAN